MLNDEQTHVEVGVELALDVGGDEVGREGEVELDIGSEGHYKGIKGR